MTQWLIEEAAFHVLDVADMVEQSGIGAEKRAQEQLQTRHEQMMALREEMRRGVR